MKKFLAVLMVLMLAVSAVAFAEITDFTGVWYASMMGMPITLTVNADGTASMDIMGEATTGSWVVEEGIFYLDKGHSSEAQLTVGDSTLVMSDPSSGIVVEFGREPVATVALPATVAAADISAFNGIWDMSKLSAFGMVLDVEEAKSTLAELLGDTENLTLVIDNGTVMAFGDENAVTYVFQDGRLLPPNAAELQAAGMDEMVSTIDLCEDGSIAYTMMGMVFYCTPVTAE